MDRNKLKFGHYISSILAVNKFKRAIFVVTKCSKISCNEDYR